MDRKKFIQNSSIVSLMFFKINHSLASRNGQNEGQSFDSSQDFDLKEASILSLQEQMKMGKLTSVTLSEFYLKRIELIDRSGPTLHSVLELNPEALDIARRMDQERKEGKIRSFLHGIPILIKDNINTGDKMMTTAGALAMQGNYAKSDAFIVEQLRKSGAVLLGKTNLSEWANFRSTASTSGWSSRGGQTKCPYVLDRNPSGSSAGTGSAIAADLCTIGIGTETNGSIVSPASVNGLVGIKPTVGLWSRNGIIPISNTQDTAGPMAKSVQDAAILLGALTGIDLQDSTTNQSKGKFEKDYTRFLKLDSLKGKKIGIEKSHLVGNEAIVNLLKKAIDQLTRQGASIIELDVLKSLDAPSSAELTVLQYEFKEGLNRYLKTFSSKIKNLQEVIEFNKVNHENAMPYFQQETLLACEATSNLEDKEYKEALRKLLTSREILLKLMKDNNLDAFGGVTNGLACCIDLVNGDYDTGFSLSTPAAIAGFPHITVPMGLIHDLPIGFSLFAEPYSEPKLIGMAYAYEQTSKNRVSPKFLPRIGI